MILPLPFLQDRVQDANITRAYGLSHLLFLCVPDTIKLKLAFYCMLSLK